VQLRRLWLTDYRSYPSLDLELPPGVTAVLGPNGRGKTNLLEAVSYLATLRSFRGAPADALVRRGTERAVVRGETLVDGREHLVEAEITGSGRNRVQVDRQRLRRTRDLVEVLRVTVFSPDDLELVKGGPAGRRGLLDDALVAAHPRHDAVRSDWERGLRQRNTLLKQLAGRPDEAGLLTLDVWDAKLAESGDRLAASRSRLVERLAPVVVQAYRDVAGAGAEVSLGYEAPWREVGMAAALEASRADDLRRGVTLVGPHRDELVVDLDGMPARTHASQGEQRSLALALRLGVHRLLHEVHGVPPVLLLDDVFSELDPERSAALLRALPEGQTLLSSAAGLPSGMGAELVVDVEPGSARPRT
jgi:DNA replication and repair protein RecF